jgi:hypothetical protein
MIIRSEETIDKDQFGIKVTLKNGEFDWYDPCTETPLEVDGNLVVNTMSYEYLIALDTIQSWEKYPLCAECGYEVKPDGWCNYPCSLAIDVI